MSMIAAAMFMISIILSFAQEARNDWKTLNKEANDLYRKGEYDKAVISAKKAVANAEKSAIPKPHNLARSLNILAILYSAQGKYVQAELLYKRFLAFKKELLGPNHPSVASSLKNLAVLYRATNRVADAKKLEARAARIRATKR